ncbi:MAG: aspartate 1-decarboxylase [Phycisphaerales bacterium]|nr:MAG: aspartate 1-decarboxylase [Phycisphaerales bacterium]
MLRKVLHSKIHMATVTAARPDYVGSITIDRRLLLAVGLRASDAVEVANTANGQRFETYVFLGQPGQIEVNGAAALLVSPGDRLIIMHYALMDQAEYARHRPRVALVGPDNALQETIRYDPWPTGDAAEG